MKKHITWVRTQHILSGSGPTILSILDGNYDGFKAGMEEYFKTNGLEWKCMILPIDNVGAVVSEI